MNCPSFYYRGFRNTYKYILQLARSHLFFSSLVLFSCFLSISTSVFAAPGINPQVNFQGKVVNKTAGTNVTDGSYNFTFRIYNAASGGTLLWTEQYNTSNGNQLPVSSGIFRASLGSVCSFSGGSCQGNTNTGVDFSDDAIYLDITFNGETMGSRIRFTASPYAFYAEKVAGLSFENNESISNGTDGTIFLGRNDAGVVTLSAKDNDSTAALVVMPGGAASLTLGSVLTTGLTITTDGTGDSEVILPTGSISSGEFLDGSLLPVDLSLATGTASDEYCLTYESTGAAFEWETCTKQQLWQLNDGAISPFSLTADLNLGTIATDSAKVSLAGSLTRGKSVAIFNQTEDQDILSASTSGTTRFTITNSGNIVLANGEMIDNSTDNTIILSSNATNGAGVLRVPVKTTTGDPGLNSGGNMYYNAADNKFRCYQGSSWVDCIPPAPNASTFTDSTPETATFTVAMDVWDGTYPNITPNTSSSKIMVSVVIRGVSEDANDHNPVFQIWKRSDGNNPTCSAVNSTALGTEFVGSFLTTTAQDWGAAATFLDSVSSTDTVRYTVCTTTTGLDDATTSDVTVTLAEVGSGITASSGTLTVNESDGSPSVSSATTLEFGPASSSSDEFTVTDQGSGIARIRLGTMVGMLNEAETVTGGWTFDTAVTTFNTLINADGGIATLLADQSLNLTTNGLGNIILGTDYDSGVYVGSGANTPAVLSVSGGIGENAAFIVNQTNNGNIIAASASGTMRFVVDSNGYVGLAGSNASASNYITSPNFIVTTSGGITAATSNTLNGININAGTISGALWNGTAIGSQFGGTGFSSYAQGDIIFASNTDTLSKLSISGSNGQCLTSNGTVPSWGSCGSAGANYWQINDGALTPFSITSDINLGATATSSAKISLAGSLTRGKALAIFNQTENQDIITASVAGVTKFVVDKDGRVGVGTQTVTGTTERLLQVGSETNRGNNATYGDIVTKGYSQIRSIANVRDVFIYDTSLDSDGGRWIDWATTDKLSWFTETLDDSPSDPCNIATDKRCYSDSFPRKAILVVTTDALYIFDATNGQMWMKFGQNVAGWALGVDTNNDPSSVTAMNGVIYVGTNGSAAGGLYAFDFISDRMWRYDDTNRASANVGIGSRNTAVTYASDANTNFDLATVGTIAGWKTINDVSVAVVQNSQTAISTTQGSGNGATIIGLATDSGLTTINLSTQRVRQYSDATDNDYNAVAVTRNARLYGLNSSLDQLELWINIDVDNIATRVNGTPDKVVDENSAPALSKGTPVINTNAPDALDVIPNGSMADGGILATAAIPANSDLIYVGHSLGLTEIHLANYTNATTFTGWSKFYNTTRQTPLMPGTIRRYHAMDDASGNVTNAAKTSIMTPKGSPTYLSQGVRNRAMTFNGTSQYLCSDNNADGTCDNDTTDNINTGGFTFTVWFKHATAIAGTDVLFARCYNTTPAAATGCISVAMNSTGQMVFTMDDDATWTIGAVTNNDVTYTTTRTYNDNQWHFLSFSKTNGAVAPVALIDGQVISYATSLTHTTMDNGQILGIGTDCSQGAACSTGGNFWDGQIDDFTYSACGSAGCTTDGLLSTSANAAAVAKRLYTDARPMINKKVITVADATTASSTTIGDLGESWIPNEFAGQVVALTGGQGAGQTRRIISNTTDTLTIAPAFVTTPDTTTDFEIDPQALIGASDNVTAVGVTKANPIGESRVMCAGTSSGADTGAITCYNHQAGPNIVADTYHADAGYADDSSVAWTGTGFDDIQSIDVTNRAWVLGSTSHTWTETQDVRLGNALDYFQGKVVDIRTQMQVMGTTTLAGQIGLDVGLSGGADVAEFYEAEEKLLPGNIVAVHPSIPSGVQMSSKEYQKNILGVVATNPGLTLGVNHDRAYPIALTGRVPVIVTTKNGEIKQGDGITSSPIAGVGVRASQAGTIIGLALEGSTYWDNTRCEKVESFEAIVWPEDDGSNTNMPCYRYMDKDEELFIGKLMVFVNVGYHQGDELIIPEVIESSTTQKVMQAFLQDVQVKSLAMNENGEIIITNSKGQEIAKVDQNGNMQIIGDLVPQKISLSTIDGIDTYTKRIEMLEEKVASLSAFSRLLYTSQAVLSASDSAMLHAATRQPVLSFEGTQAATIAGKLRVKGTSLFEEFVHVIDTLMTKNFIVNGIASFFGKATFKEDVEVQGKLSVGRDTSGIAILKKGTDTVTVTFLSEYEQTPMVTTSITLETIVDETAEVSVREEQEKVQAALEASILNGDIQYVVTRKSKKGFVIKINKAAPEDISFTWTALGISKEKEDAILVSPGVVSDVLGERVGSTSTPSAVIISPGISLSIVPEEGSKTVTILENELGYLRVREAPRSSTPEIGQVLPGESYKVLAADNGWFKIGYAADRTGWVSSLYVKVTY